MRSITTIITAATLLSFQGAADAQLMTFKDSTLASGEELQQGAAYRFSNVTSGIDAVVTVDALHQTHLINIDADNGISNGAWTPVFAGTGSYGLHYADFTVLFYANGTDTPNAPELFTTTVYGNDLNDSSDSFLMEFVQVAGFTSILNADESVQTLEYADSSQLAMASNGSDPWLAAWKFENKPGYTIRFGWQGGDGPEEGRAYNALMTSNGGTSPSTIPGTVSDFQTVPEPSTSFLFVLSVFPLAFRRKRQEKSSK